MKKELDIFTIYSISTNGVVFYIGRTCDFKRRKSEHLYDTSKTYKANKIRKIKTLGLPLEFNILHENLSFDDSVKLEIKEIKEHKDKGVVLTNLTDGGEGLFGVKRVFTDEWKANLKTARKALFDDGYEVVNKGKSLEELIGEQKAKEQKERVGNKISEGIKSGKIDHNKGKKLDDIVGTERAKELKKEFSDRAKNIFTGVKQSSEHIDKRITKQKQSKANWTEEQREEVRKINKINGSKSIKKFKFNVDGFKHYGTWKSLSEALKEELGINVSSVSLSDLYRGKYKSLNCGVNSIIIESQLND